MIAPMTPIALLIPGMLNDARVWADVTDALAGIAEVRIADVLTQDSIAAMARDALALVADVPADRPVVLVGFSMGGYVAGELLATESGRWKAAVLIATSCLPETPEGAAGREMAIAAFRSDFEATIQAVARRGLGRPDEALQARLVPMMRDVGADTAVRQTQAIRGRADRRAELARLALPVQVLCGRKDRVTPPPLSQALADTVPGAVLQWVDDAGHMLPLEHPRLVADAVRRALA